MSFLKKSTRYRNVHWTVSHLSDLVGEPLLISFGLYSFQNVHKISTFIYSCSISYWNNGVVNFFTWTRRDAYTSHDVNLPCNCTVLTTKIVKYQNFLFKSINVTHVPSASFHCHIYRSTSRYPRHIPADFYWCITRVRTSATGPRHRAPSMSRFRQLSGSSHHPRKRPRGRRWVHSGRRNLL